MNKLLTKIAGVALGLTMAIGVGVAIGASKEAAPVHAASSTYYMTPDKATSGSSSTQYITTATTFTANGITWSMNQWNPSTLQIKCNQSSATSEFNFHNTTAFSARISKVVITFQSLTVSDSSKLCFLGGTSAVTATTGGSAGTWDSTKLTLTWTPESSTNYTYFAFYQNGKAASGTNKLATSNAIAVTYGVDDIAAYVDGNSSVNVNSEYTATVKKTSDDSTVSGTITYVYTPSNGAVLSSPNPDGEGKGTNTTGKFTASSAGKITISASLSGYTITSKDVTVNSVDPYINLTLTSSATAYTGQTVTITSEYGNGVTGLNWSVQSGSISGTATTSNSGYSAKISNTAGTLTIRATDTGSALYSEVSVTVTKTAFTTSPAATASVAEGKTTTLTAVLNSGGTINWISDDTDVATVSAGVVTGVEAGTATITATSADDSTVSASCTVTVTEAPSEIVITQAEISGFTSSYKEYDWTYGTGTNAISGKIKAYKNSSNIQMNHNNTCYIYNTDAVKGYITGITFTKVSGTTDLTCWVGTSALSSDPASGGSTNTTYTWSFDAEDHYTYFRVATSGSTGARVASAITITYQKVSTVDPTGITLNDSSTINMDTYGYGRRRLSATVEPFNANDKTVTWGTSDSSVVTVTDGVLTAVGTGTTTVYAQTANFVSVESTPDLRTSVTVHVTEALYKKATFVPTSTSTATQTDDYLEDGSVSLSATSAGSWNNDKSAIQLTSGKDVTFTISGYAGMKISGVDLIVSSNGNAGSGALTVTAGTTDILEIDAAFNDESWNGAYDANACDLYKVTTEYVVEAGETIKFAFSASVNSLYIHSVAIRYLDYSLEQWCENFLDTITCDGVGSITSDSDWDDLGIAFLDLDDDLKTLAAKATANKDSDSVIEQAMARYDLIIIKYGTSAHDEFIGRFGEGTINGTLRASMSLLGLNGDSTNSTLIIVVISLVSLTAVGGYFFLKKKKAQ